MLCSATGAVTVTYYYLIVQSSQNIIWLHGEIMSHLLDFAHVLEFMFTLLENKTNSLECLKRAASLAAL